MKPDLSGVLEERRYTHVIGSNGNLVRKEEKPLFTVSYNGSISVESLQGTDYYEFAKECDSEIKNDWLQGSEIRKFLTKFSANDVHTNTNDLVYYQEKNKDGVVTKICTLIDNAKKGFVDEQCSLFYDDSGNFIKETTYQIPGKKFEGLYTYDLQTMRGHITDEDGNIVASGRLTSEQIDAAQSISQKVKNQKPNNGLLQIIDIMKSKLRIN